MRTVTERQVATRPLAGDTLPATIEEISRVQTYDGENRATAKVVTECGLMFRVPLATDLDGVPQRQLGDVVYVEVL